MMNYYMCDEFHDNVEIFESIDPLLEISNGKLITYEDVNALWEELYETTGKNTKEERFFYVLQYYSTDKIKSLDEWIVFGQHNNDDREERCICSQHIAHVIYFINNTNDNIIQVGNSCINKFGSCEQKNKLIRFNANIKQLEKLKSIAERRKIYAEYYEANKERILKKQDEIIAKCKENLAKYGPNYY